MVFAYALVSNQDRAARELQVGGQQVVYDALTMPVVDPAMVVFAFFGFVAFSAGTAVNWLRLRRRPALQSEARSKEMMGFGVTILMALGAAAFLVYSGAQTVLWRFGYAHHRYIILDGCVAQFNESVYSDHDMGVDNFALQGRPFRLSDSGWRAGYHVSHHHGSLIEDGVHLRAFAQGQRLLRIELLATPCHGGSPNVPSHP